MDEDEVIAHKSKEKEKVSRSVCGSYCKVANTPSLLSSEPYVLTCIIHRSRNGSIKTIKVTLLTHCKEQ